MPVPDHPIHPSTIALSGHKHGCFNRLDFRCSLLVKNGYDLEGKMTWKTTPNTFTKTCHYDERSVHSYCSGCKHI